ncbi:MAG: hypothetical protein WBW33_23455, partial [Bryobacteraceae bacterium]
VERRSFQRLLARESELFKEEQRLSAQTTNQLTGGPSYAVVAALLALPVKGPNTFALSAFIGDRREKNNLVDARIYIEQEEPDFGTKAWALERVTGRGHAPVWTGDILATSAMIIPEVKITPSITGVTTYIVSVYARNRPTVETLQIRRNPQSEAWEQSYKILRVLRFGGPGKKDVVETLEVTNPTWRGSRFIEAK